MFFVLVDFAEGADEVVRINTNRSAEAVAVLGVLQPPAYQHLVVGCGDGGSKVPVRHDSTCHGMQDRDVDVVVDEQMTGSQIRIRAWVDVLTRPASTRYVFAARSAVPVHLIVRKSSAAKRFTHEGVAEVVVGLAEDVNARIDQRADTSIRMLEHSADSRRAQPTCH